MFDRVLNMLLPKKNVLELLFQGLFAFEHSAVNRFIFPETHGLYSRYIHEHFESTK